jgi:hypothetical protein
MPARSAEVTDAAEAARGVGCREGEVEPDERAFAGPETIAPGLGVDPSVAAAAHRNHSIQRLAAPERHSLEQREKSSRMGRPQRQARFDQVVPQWARYQKL